MLLDRCLSVLSVCPVCALWLNGWTDQDETWRAGRPRPWPHCVRWGPSSSSPKGAQPLNFPPVSFAAKWLHGSRCHLVWSYTSAQANLCWMGTPLPQFSPGVYCGQKAGWMKLVLGMEVGLSPGDFVLDGDLAALPKGGGAPSPIFGPFLLWPNGWMHQDGTWYGCRPHPRGLCVRWRTSPPSPTRGRSPPPNFRPMSIVAKRLDESICHLV